MFFISQIGECDCAITCLNMLLANYHHDKNYLFLKHEDRPYSFKELIEIGEKYHLSLTGVKIEDALEITKCESFPIIVTIRNIDKSRHSVLLVKANSKKVTYFDPLFGKVSESFDDFASKWTKHALIVGELTKTTCDIIPPHFVAKKDKITLPIFQLLSGVSFLLATFFIDRNVDMVIPIIFFALFFVFELIFRENLVRAMRRIDENLEEYDLDIPKEKYKDLFTSSEKYRIKALTRVSEVINAGLISLFLIFIVLINDKMNAIYVALTIFLALVECLAFNPFIEKKTINLARQEQEILHSDSEVEYKLLARTTREQAYRLGQYRVIFNYVSIGIILFSIVLVMSLTQNINVTYIVFYLCICLFLRTNLLKVLTYEEMTRQKDNEQIKIICYLKDK